MNPRRGGEREGRTLQLGLKGIVHIPKLDDLERFEHVRGGDGFVLFGERDVVCAGIQTREHKRVNTRLTGGSTRWSRGLRGG